MKDQLVRELEAQKAGHPSYISDLTERAAQEILQLRAEVARMHSDRQYIMGCIPLTQVYGFGIHSTWKRVNQHPPILVFATSLSASLTMRLA